MRRIFDKTFLAVRRLAVALVVAAAVALAVIWGGAIVGLIDQPASTTADLWQLVAEHGGWRQFAVVITGGTLGFLIFGEVEPGSMAGGDGGGGEER